MFCPNCGKEIIVENAKFCFQCGYCLADLTDYENCSEQLENSDTDEDDVIEELSQNLESEEIENEEIENEMLPTTVSEESNEFALIPLIDNEGDDVQFETFLFDKERIAHYQTYISGMDYVLPLGNYSVRFNRDCIVYANIVSYMEGVRDTALSVFQEYYKNNVRNMDEWISKACPKSTELMKWMRKKAENLLIASKIYDYSADSLSKNIDRSRFDARLSSIYKRYMEVCENAEEVKMMREMAKDSSSGGFIGGGFGFSGAMGGIMAAGIANAGVGVARGVKNGITALGDSLKANANKRAVFKNPENYAVLEDMIYYEAACLRTLCRKIIDRETGHVHSIYQDDERAEMLVTHAIEYAQDTNEFWQDITQAIEACPYCIEAYEAIYCKYYKNLTLMEQLKEIYKLFLLDDIDDDIDDLYEKEIQEVLQMPENTSTEVKEKLDCLQEKINVYKKDRKEEETRLRDLLITLQKKEEEQKRYTALLESYLPEASKVEQTIQEKDYRTLFEMIENGSFIAEERYISYYVQKIKEDDNVQLYNSIASNAGKHRAYLCIAGVCNYYGWGAYKDIDIAKSCILKSAEANCSYAQAFICRTYLEGKGQIANEEKAKKYLSRLKDLASPTFLLYYGSALSSTQKAVREKCSEDDYENMVMYLDYAEKCCISGAKQILEKIRK